MTEIFKRGSWRSAAVHWITKAGGIDDCDRCHCAIVWWKCTAKWRLTTIITTTKTTKRTSIVTSLILAANALFLKVISNSLSRHYTNDAFYLLTYVRGKTLKVWCC